MTESVMNELAIVGVILEKLIFTELVKKYSVSGMQKFIAELITVQHWTLF
jgi:hypothetical protein